MIENLYATNSIRTFTGIYINVFDPTTEMICIEDIAHALSHQCRFGGHLPEFYSVAQHCYLAATEALPEDKLQALMHDASEAYLLDIPRPIKQELSNYKEIEGRLMSFIARKFQFDYPMSDAVKDIDEGLLVMEWECLMIRTRPAFKCWKPQEAKNKFIEMFNGLTEK